MATESIALANAVKDLRRSIDQLSSALNQNNRLMHEMLKQKSDELKLSEPPTTRKI